MCSSLCSGVSCLLGSSLTGAWNVHVRISYWKWCWCSVNVRWFFLHLITPMWSYIVVMVLSKLNKSDRHLIAGVDLAQKHTVPQTLAHIKQRGVTIHTNNHKVCLAEGWLLLLCVSIQVLPLLYFTNSDLHSCDCAEQASLVV